MVAGTALVSGTAVVAPGVAQSVARQARARPGAVALRFGEASLTYGTLDDRANRVVDRLHALGVGRGCVVAVLAARGFDPVVGALGVLRAGAAYLPLDPAHPAHRLSFLLSDSRAAAGVVDEAWEPAIAGVGIPTVVVDGDSGGDPGEQKHPVLPPSVDDLAYVIYTSGSTGTPKGVMISHGGLDDLVRWAVEALGIGPGARVAWVSAPAFDVSVLELWPTLAAGAELCIIDDRSRRDGPALAAHLLRDEVQVAFVPTVLAEGVVRHLALGAASALRILYTGGDRLVSRPPAGLPFEVLNVYGPTEATVISTAGVVEPVGDGAPSIGRPIGTLDVDLLGEDLRPVTAGSIGEVCLAGAQVARGYLGRPGLTAERFVPDPLGRRAGGRIYRSGDLAREATDGTLEFVGRDDDQVSIRGHRVELAEITFVLERHPGVARAAAVAVPRDGWADLVAFVQCPAPVPPAELRSFATDCLPAPMVPGRIVVVDELPLNHNGKVDRSRLRELAGDTGPTVDAAAPPPRTAMEFVARLWCDVLGVGDVSPVASLFDLGGHSLTASRLVYTLNETFDVELSLTEFFDAPTVAALSTMLEKALLAQIDAADAAGAEAEAEDGR